MKTDWTALHDELTDRFIDYQYRLDHPMPSMTETIAVRRAQYMNDPVFRARVASLVTGVIEVVRKHVE